MPSIRSIVLPFKAKFSGEDAKDRNRLFEAFAEVEKQLLAAASGTGGLNFCRAGSTANLNVANNTVTAVPFDTTIAQNGGMHSDSSQNSRFTIFRAGLYEISGHIMWPATNAGVRRIGIRLNGANIIAEQEEPSPAAAAPALRQSVGTGYFLNAADYVEIIVYQNSGGAINVVPATEYSLYAWIGEH